MAQRQINIRLADDDFAVLEAASFLKRNPIHDLVRSIVLEQVASWRQAPRVQRALTLQAEAMAEQEGVLASLDDRREEGTEKRG